MLLVLSALEAASLVLVIALFKYADRFPALTTREVMWIVAPLVSSVACVAYIVRGHRRLGPRLFGLTLATNALTVVMLLATAEIGIRLFATPTPVGTSFANTVLLPKDWDQVRRRNAGLLKNAPANISYFVSDDLLGWTVGRSRRSADGLYLSSAEGIRSPRSDTVYADRRASHLVAAVGDSFTFGLEVPFHESWGSQLEKALGSEYTVLNFGVDGYGVDQAYLRYDRDVRVWRPALTVFGFINHDLYRSTVVYPFVSFPEWGFPFSKPRFTLEAGTLRLLNSPLPRPAEILARGSIAELPFVQYDPGYRAAEWQWHFYHASHVVRFLLSRFPRQPVWNPAAEAEALSQLNSQLLLSFVRRATHDGTEPLIVYFPSRGDFEGQDRSAKSALLSSLKRLGIDYVDLTPCLRDADPARAFIAGRPHYSAHGNAAVARCLLPAVLGR
jgi:hypothetical protein